MENTECIGLLRVLVAIFLFCHDVWGGWSFWSDWSPCSYPCEGKTKWRRRHCLTQFCNGMYFQYEYCEPQDCLLETTLPPVALRHNHTNNSFTSQKTMTHLPTSRAVRETLQTILITNLVPIPTNLLRKTKQQNEKNINTLEEISPTTSPETERDSDETKVQKKTQEVTMEASHRAHHNINAKQNDQPMSKERGKDSNVDIVILVAVPTLAACGVAYTIAKIYKIIKDRQVNSTEGIVNTAGKWSSLSVRKTSSPEEERGVQEYNYVSYDEISKRSSYENSSPSPSYVYDVNWN